MLLLAFDTATPAVTVALHDGQRVLAETVTVDARRHGELLAPSIAKVVADAGAEPGDLTAIVTGVGPGPYTGLRVGVVTARVFGRTLALPVYGVCTLDVLAGAAVPAAAGREFLAVTDARRKGLYWGRYDGSGSRISGPAVSRPAEIPDGAVLPVAGQAATLYPEQLGEPIWREHPSAAVLAELAAERLAFPGPGWRFYGPSRVVPAPAGRPGSRPAEAGDVAVSVRLRSLRYDDLAAVLDLERSLFPDDAWSPGMFAEALAMQGCGRHYVAAEEGNKLVGYAGMMLPGGRQAEVLTLAVNTAHWGRGIGSTLLTDLLDEAGRHDCTEMCLEARADNPRLGTSTAGSGFRRRNPRGYYHRPAWTPS